MPLINHLFKIVSTDSPAGCHHQIEIEIIPDHPVFNGHFPGNPVMPGVCTLAIILECSEAILNYPLKLVEAIDIKYSGMIIPSMDKNLFVNMLMDMNGDDASIKATIVSKNEKVMSCKLKVTKENHSENR